MAQQTINVGASPNDGTGTPLRTAFQYTNSNFSELYTAVGPSGNNIVVPGSATITGDLTVDTSTLKVDSANNRVGVGTASPAQALDVASGNLQVRTGGTIYSDTFSNYGAALQINAAGSLPLRLQIGGSNAYEITSANVHTWSNVGGVAGTAMTLNSTGLGVGVTPITQARLSLKSSAGSPLNLVLQNRDASQNWQFYVDGVVVGDGILTINNGTSSVMQVTPSGNVGIGVTPSAWTTYYALQIRNGSIANYSPTQDLRISSNAYYASGVWKRIAAAYATQYLQDGSSGIHQWYVAATGAADSTITTFTTAAMTLDASGNLLVGTTSSPLASRVSVGVTNGQPDAFVIRNSAATAGLYWRLAYVNSANTFHILNQGGVGVYLTDGATSWTGTSDERLKDIIEPISNAVAKVGSLRSVIGKFKTDSEGTRRSFLIAQDVQSVLPEAVDTTNADAFGVRYSEVIPLLVAAIKELTARVQTLETR